MGSIASSAPGRFSIILSGIAFLIVRFLFSHLASAKSFVLVTSAIGAKPPDISPLIVAYPMYASDLSDVAIGIAFGNSLLIPHKIIALERACILSFVNGFLYLSCQFVSIVLKSSSKHLFVVSNISIIGAWVKFIPKLFAKSSASLLLSLLVIFEGMLTPYTFSAPRASAKSTAQTVESNPPDSPKTARFNPFLLK